MVKLAFVAWLLNNPNVFWYGMLGAFLLFCVAGACGLYCKKHRMFG